MRHVHAKVWPGGKRPPGPIVKAGTIYQRSPHSSLIWIVKFVRIFIAEKCSSGQQGKVFGSWVVVKFPKQKLTSCLMVGVATRRSATMFCIFKVSWLVVCFSCARARAHRHMLWGWQPCERHHDSGAETGALNIIECPFSGCKAMKTTTTPEITEVWQTAGDSCMLLDMRCDVIYIFYFLFFVRVWQCVLYMYNVVLISHCKL